MYEVAQNIISPSRSTRSILRGNAWLRRTLLQRVLVLMLIPVAHGAVARNVSANNVVVFGKEDTTTILRNPAMGWVFYDTSDQPLPTSWWHSMNPVLSKCNIWYWRDSWAKLEPAPGQYAWKVNPQFRAYIHQIVAHGFKLAFRVIVSSHNFSQPATPQWVRDMGVTGRVRVTHGWDGKPYKLWSPNYDDPIFKAQFAKFVKAFGKAFDNPKEVDFIDANGLGWWGEVHHLRIQVSEYDSEYNWICSTYSRAFKHVLLVTNVFSEFSQGNGQADMQIAHDKYGYLFRRDGLGSHWYSHDNIETFDKEMFPASPLFGELCYSNWTPAIQQEEAAKGVKSFREDLIWAMDQGLRSHANTMNFPGNWRVFPPEQVQRFIRRGGYRFYPGRVTFPSVVRHGRALVVSSTWRNGGVGLLPNATPQWNHKYKLAYSFLPVHGVVPTLVALERHAHLAQWVAGKEFVYRTAIKCNVPHGLYRLAVGIVDTTQYNAPAISLAVANLRNIGKWYVLGNVMVR